QEVLTTAKRVGDYTPAFAAIGQLLPVFARWFVDEWALPDELGVREHRLRLMNAISTSCSELASLHLLAR
ncbi:MAG: glycyl-tRNA synthetase subunit beta, partial [Pseudomonadota bacterium]